MTLSWASLDWDGGDANANQIVFGATWSLPLTGALTIERGIGATVKADRGEIVLLVCGGDGEIDTVPEDGQTIPVADGESVKFEEGSSVYIFLDSTSATFWIFGAGQGFGPESVVKIEVLGDNGVPQICGYATCWVAPELPPKPAASDCNEETCTVGQPGGCAGIRCWFP
jgi:hypothetical protein